ncbi:hypothetical protein DPMN_154128 [Dreissena polymorpha]|uniref:Uncharacterized protein n=1 Tax=Dreissena polymorpha TaxID=45954 RepID=A0A9D4J6P9_DREPO|nr:hypothetical protein DPMN_154128 [Dreissena polymorpha]
MCCVCHKRFPEALRGCTSLVIVKCGQCDQCGHWVHLRFCSSVSGETLSSGAFIVHNSRLKSKK